MNDPLSHCELRVQIYFNDFQYFQKQPPEVFYKKAVKPATLLKRDSNTVVFLRILRNF